MHPMTSGVLRRHEVQPDGCWRWLGKTDRAGYGQSGRTMAHRRYYQELVGPIPAGLQLDHLCRFKTCVNPAHLEPVTAAENARRRDVARTHCIYGHEFTPENTRMDKRGRACRACCARRTREYEQRKAA